MRSQTKEALRHADIGSVQSLNRIRLFATPWTAAHQASLSITNSEFAQTHIHQVNDAVKPSHPLSSPSPPTYTNDLSLPFDSCSFYATLATSLLEENWSF